MTDHDWGGLYARRLHRALVPLRDVNAGRRDHADHRKCYGEDDNRTTHVDAPFFGGNALPVNAVPQRQSRGYWHVSLVNGGSFCTALLKAKPRLDGASRKEGCICDTVQQGKHRADVQFR